jgi:hypothetical protein
VPAGADGSSRLAHARRERRYWIVIVISAILGLVLGYFYDKEVDRARLDCETRGGKLEVRRTDYRCVLPGEPGAP